MPSGRSGRGDRFDSAGGGQSIRASSFVQTTIAVACLGAGAIHFSTSGEHGDLFGAAFLAMGAFQVAWALAVALYPTRLVLLAGLAGNASIMAVWLTAHTGGLPFGPGAGQPEATGFKDLTATALELVVVLGALALLHAEAAPRLRAAAFPPAASSAFVAAAALAAGMAVATPHAHGPHAGGGHGDGHGDAHGEEHADEEGDTHADAGPGGPAHDGPAHGGGHAKGSHGGASHSRAPHGGGRGHASMPAAHHGGSDAGDTHAGAPHSGGRDHDTHRQRHRGDGERHGKHRGGRDGHGHGGGSGEDQHAGGHGGAHPDGGGHGHGGGSEDQPDGVAFEAGRPAQDGKPGRGSAVVFRGQPSENEGPGHHGESGPCQPTPEQEAAADTLYRQTDEALRRYEGNPQRALADGFTYVFGPTDRYFHMVNRDRLRDGKILDPAAIESFLYTMTDRGLVAIGGMYIMPEYGMAGPEVGGCRTKWHHHAGVGGRIASAGSMDRTPEMLHVWTYPGLDPWGHYDGRDVSQLWAPGRHAPSVCRQSGDASDTCF